MSERTPPAEGSPILLAIGTYTEPMPHVDGKGPGVVLVPFDQVSGAFGTSVVTGGVQNPSYLAVSQRGDRLYSVAEVDDESEAALDVFALDAPAMRLTHLARLPAEGRAPCHVSLHEQAGHLYVSNYMSGTFAVFGLDAGGLPSLQARLRRDGSSAHPERQRQPHAHFALPSPDGHHVWFADLGTDSILRHPIRDGRVAPDADLTIRAQPGDGPRHFAFSPSGRFLLAIHELSSVLSLYDLQTDGREVARLTTLPDGWSGANTTAAVRVHPSGRFVYGSNRGHESIFIARLDETAGTLRPVGHTRLRGRSPREIAITPNGRLLLAASQDDDLVEVFAIDAENGTLSPAGTSFAVGTPVCLCFVSSQRPQPPKA